jgi:phytoene dehydrogenase-like protein
LKDPVLKEAFNEMWIPEFSLFFMLFTFAWLHRKNAGYPIGGSLPMSLALEKKFLELGGEIIYNSKVEKTITEDGKATGILLADGTSHSAGRIISAADGYHTIFKMLEGKYVSPEIEKQYREWPTFHSLLFVSLGINRTLEDIPLSVSGLSFPLKEPVEIAGKTIHRLPVHPYHHDPSMSPPGKNIMIVMLESDYDYWKTLAEDRPAYLAAKKEALQTIIHLLEQRFPGISAQVEMTDVATPMTFERYTGNWKGSFEGWLITPDNAGVMIKPLKQTLPGLQNFYMCGQWVEPGGGLPTGISSGRRLVKAICKEDGKKFNS